MFTNKCVCGQGRNGVHFILRIFVSESRISCVFFFFLTFIFVLFCIKCKSFCLKWTYITFSISIAWFLKEGKRKERDSGFITPGYSFEVMGIEWLLLLLLFCFRNLQKWKGKKKKANKPIRKTSGKNNRSMKLELGYITGGENPPPIWIIQPNVLRHSWANRTWRGNNPRRGHCGF